MDFSAKRSEVLLKLHTHTQNVLLYYMYCYVYYMEKIFIVY